MKRITKYHTVDTGAFVKRTPESPALPADTRILLTYQGRKEIRSAILDAVHNAEKYIKLCSFIITDKEVVEALIERAQKFDLSIFILTQLDDRNITDSFLTDEELSNTSGKDHLNNLGKLNRVGVHIRAASDIHAKFLIVDGEYSLITSANITNTSMNKIPESGIIVRDERSSELETLFDKIYRYGAPFRNFAVDSRGNRNIRQTNLNEIRNEELPLGGSGFSYTYKSQVNKLYKDIVGVIRSATSDVYISTYSIKELSAIPDFVSAVSEAISKNININIFCRAMNYRSDHLAACSELKKLGCVIRGDVFNHAKGVVTNDAGLIFTANIDGEHGLINGFEIGTRLIGNEVNDLLDLSIFFFESSPFEFTEGPELKDVFGYFNTTYQAKSTYNSLRFEELKMIIDSESSFSYNLLDRFFLYGIVDGDQLVGIEVGDQLFESNLDRDNNKIIIGSKVNRLPSSVKFIIEFNTLNIENGQS